MGIVGRALVTGRAGAEREACVVGFEPGRPRPPAVPQAAYERVITMHAIGTRHAACVDRLTALLVHHVGGDGLVRVQAR